MNAPVEKKKERSALRTLIVGVVLFCGMVFTLVYLLFGVVVPPDSIGIRNNFFSFGFIEQGYSKTALAPGLHLRVPGISEIELLPHGFQFINLGSEFEHGEFERGTLDLPALQIQSSNGPRVNTGVTLIVRFFESEESTGPKEIELAPVPDGGPVPLPKPQAVSHGGPRNLITYFGFDPIARLTKFTRIAQNELVNRLNELSSSDFYNPILREQATLEAHKRINTLVNPVGVEVWGTLIRRYTYEKEEIDNQIFAKNLQTQTAKLRIAQTELATETAKLGKTKEEWTQKIQEKNVEAQSYLLRQQSEARFAEETKIAEGEKEYKSRLAEVTAQKNRLLAEMPGAEIYVARSMVPMIKTLSGGLVSNLDPYDVDAWVKKLTGLSKAREGQ